MRWLQSETEDEEVGQKDVYVGQNFKGKKNQKTANDDGLFCKRVFTRLNVYNLKIIRILFENTCSVIQ